MPRRKVPPCYCYIVECVDGSLYTGWTTDPEARLRAHNAGRGGRYTRSRRPVRLVHLETQASPSHAMKRERAIKNLTRARKLRLIAARSEPDARCLVGFLRIGEQREMAERDDLLPLGALALGEDGCLLHDRGARALHQYAHALKS